MDVDEQRKRYREEMGSERADRQEALWERHREGLCTCTVGDAETAPGAHLLGCAYRSRKARTSARKRR